MDDLKTTLPTPLRLFRAVIGAILTEFKHSDVKITLYIAQNNDLGVHPLLPHMGLLLLCLGTTILETGLRHNRIQT